MLRSVLLAGNLRAAMNTSGEYLEGQLHCRYIAVALPLHCRYIPPGQVLPTCPAKSYEQLQGWSRRLGGGSNQGGAPLLGTTAT